MSELFEPPVSTSNLYTPDLDNLCNIFATAFDERGYLIPGSLVARLEAKLCEYHDSEYCVAFSTGFWALVAAVRAKALPQRHEVIIPSLTYRRLADVVYWSGNVPVFVDVESSNLAICPSAVEQAITRHTALILAVHPIVNCCDVSGLISIAESNAVPVVFDAVESMHETLDHRRIGSFGVGEVFSLHASKLINGLEGGYVCTNEPALKEKLRSFRNGELCDEIGDSEIGDTPLGLNSLMNDGHAALALASLEEIARNTDHNRLIYHTYLRELNAVPGIRLLSFDELEQTSFKNIVAEVDDAFPLNRDELVKTMNAQGMLARAYYSPALHSKPYDYPVKKTEQTGLADKVVNRFINLPCGQRVSEHDVVTICQFLVSQLTSKSEAFV